MFMWYRFYRKAVNWNLVSLYFQVVGNSVAFSLGLATTLALLGIAASFAGKAYGQIGQGLPLAASGLAVIMGLNLLEVLIKAGLVVWTTKLQTWLFIYFCEQNTWNWNANFGRRVDVGQCFSHLYHLTPEIFSTESFA